MKVWNSTSTDRQPCVICGCKMGDHAGFKTAGVALEIYACDGEHMHYVQRQYAQRLIEPLLTQARIIAHGRPGQGTPPPGDAC